MSKRACSNRWLLPIALLGAAVTLGGCKGGGAGGGMNRANLVGDWESTDDKGITEWTFYANNMFEITEHRTNKRGRMDGTYKFEGDVLKISPLEVSARASRYDRQVYENELTRSRTMNLSWQSGTEFDAKDDNTGRTMHFVKVKKK